MTLIAFAASRGRAEIITDTRTYTHTATRMGHTSKVMLLPHLDAAVMDQGSTGFGKQWRFEAMNLSQVATDFDDLHRRTPAAAAAVWERMTGDLAAENRQHGTSATLANSVVFHVGYSPERESFKAYGYASDFGFEPMDLAGLYVMPSPLSVRPGDLELHRLRNHLSAIGGAEGAATADALGQLPAPTVPRGPADWVALAKAVRQDRSLADIYSGFKTYIGGDVFHVSLRQGEATTRRIHRFTDSGPEFAQMMAGSLHPVSQAAPCDCGSGNRYVDCCLVPSLDKPCICRSGANLRDCCSILAADS